MSERPYRVRPWDPGDVLAGSDNAGPEHERAPRDGSAWRRSLVADLDGAVVGEATAATNAIHPGRFPASVEVSAVWRGSGIGGALLDGLLGLRPRPLPLSARIRPDDEASTALVRSRGGRVYQRCPGATPDPREDDVRRWSHAQLDAGGPALAPLSLLEPSERADLWVEQYVWVHADWSPASASALRELAHVLVAEADPELSVVAIRGSVVDAVAWAFDEGDGSWSLVCETARRTTDAGTAAVARVLAQCLEGLARRGVRRAEVDGHDGDPHLAPVLRTLPPVPTSPVLLVEIP